MNEDNLKRVNDAVTYARTHVPFYQSLYTRQGEGPFNITEFKNLPIVTDYLLATQRSSDLKSDTEELFVTNVPINVYKPNCQHVRLLSKEDCVVEAKMLEFLLDESEYYKTIEHPRMMVVCDEDHLLGIDEMVTELCYYENPLAMMTIRNHSNEEIKRELASFQPDMLFLATPRRIPEEVIPETTRFVYTFSQMEMHPPIDTNESDNMRHHFDLYSHPFIGFIGVRYFRDDHYTFSQEHLHIETDAAGHLMFTTLAHKLQPKIRYLSRDIGEVIDDDKLILTFKGESQK